MNDKIKNAFGEIQADTALKAKTAAYLRKNRKHKSIAPRLITSLAAAALLLIGVVTYNLWFTADSYVSIDINPSVELEINRFGKVIGTSAFNDDGERVLDEVRLHGKNYTLATKDILAQTIADGYFTADTLVSVTVQTTNEKEQSMRSALTYFINEHLSLQGQAARVEIIPVTAETRQNAHGCHMSAAKYLAIQELLEVDGTATLDEYSDQSISQIRERTEQCRHAGGMGGGHGGAGHHR